VAAVAGPAHFRQVHWVEQVHGSEVVVVGPPHPSPAPPEPGPEPRRVVAVRAGTADGLVAAVPSVALAVLTADCASIALGSGEGVFAAVHAGWRGLLDGVVGAAVRAMRSMGATGVVGALGPCIHPECYEFGPGDLDRVAAGLGPAVRGRTATGGPALDLPASVAAALAAAGAGQVAGVDACTACAGGHFSHRARGDQGRQALAVWSEAGPQ
jgi:copper oxidase (laccase) domain-containing protein